MSAPGSTRSSPPTSRACSPSERRFLFGLCYRMTGSADDAGRPRAGDLRARARAAPARTDVPWRPWLVRVALNLARDELRRRKRPRYKGPWLPEPVDDAEPRRALARARVDDRALRAARGVSFAFLLALEALSPAQRAVLLLRDVFEYPGAEARRGARPVGGERARSPAPRAATRSPTTTRGGCPRDASVARGARSGARPLHGRVRQAGRPGMEALLAEDVVTLNDTNGRYPAAGVAVVGRSKVARFHAGIARLREARRRVIQSPLAQRRPSRSTSSSIRGPSRLAPRFAMMPATSTRTGSCAGSTACSRPQSSSGSAHRVQDLPRHRVAGGEGLAARAWCRRAVRESLELLHRRRAR